MVGERLAAVCRPRGFSDGRLKIEILDADWGVALRSMEKELSEKLRTATGDEVSRVSFA